MDIFKLGAMYWLGSNSTDEEAKRIAQEYGDWVRNIVYSKVHYLGKWYRFSLFLAYGEEIARLLDFCGRLEREGISFFYFFDRNKEDKVFIYLITDPKFVKICVGLWGVQKYSPFDKWLKHLDFIRHTTADENLKKAATKFHRQISNLQKRGEEIFRKCLNLAVIGDEISYRRAVRLGARYIQRREQILGNKVLQAMLKGAVLVENL